MHLLLSSLLIPHSQPHPLFPCAVSDPAPNQISPQLTPETVRLTSSPQQNCQAHPHPQACRETRPDQAAERGKAAHHRHPPHPEAGKEKAASPPHQQPRREAGTGTAAPHRRQHQQHREEGTGTAAPLLQQQHRRRRRRVAGKGMVERRVRLAEGRRRVGGSCRVWACCRAGRRRGAAAGRRSLGRGRRRSRAGFGGASGWRGLGLRRRRRKLCCLSLTVLFRGRFLHRSGVLA